MSQGKKRKNPGNPQRLAGASRPGQPAPSRRGLSAGHKRLIAVGLVLVLGLAFAGFAAFRGLEAEGLPEGALVNVDGVDGGAIEQAEFDRTLEQLAAGQGLKKPPSEDNPQYPGYVEQALNQLVQERWVRGEAADKGIVITDEEIADELETILKEQFGDSRKAFEKFAVDGKFCTEDEIEASAEEELPSCAGVDEQVALVIAFEELQEQVIGPQTEQAAKALIKAVPAEDVELYYESNIETYTQPESREALIILNKDEEKIAEAQAQLEEDDSPKAWAKVAMEFSTDPATKATGGLMRGLIEGQPSPGGPDFDEAVFSAEEGELVGPIETDLGNYLFEVTKVTPEKVTPLKKVEEQIRQILAGTEQQIAAQEFESDLVSKWTERTICAEDYIFQSCANFDPRVNTDPAVPDQCHPDDAPAGAPVPPGGGQLGVTALPPECGCPPEQLEPPPTPRGRGAQAQQPEPAEPLGCPPPVISPKPMAPGEATIGVATVNGLPQGPIPAPDPDALEGAFPPGAFPLGPGGAPIPGVPPTG